MPSLSPRIVTGTMDTLRLSPALATSGDSTCNDVRDALVPNQPPKGCEFLDFSGIAAPKLTHYLFRFPAKFHPPVAHALLQAYTTVGQTVLDPFCGSGTLLVAAAAEGRYAIGVDVDPVAVFVSRGKTHRYRPGHLRTSWGLLREHLESLRRSAAEYDDFRFNDISMIEYRSIISTEGLSIPKIPNLLHWFRRYAIVDLARILNCIERVDIPRTHREFFRLVFASIIRGASNADPIPVSGLEVTAHMKALDAAGRLINPFDLFIQATGKGLLAISEYRECSNPASKISVVEADVTLLGGRLRKQVDAIITSPPYHNAVDYYRRHQLEMYWLGFTKDHTQRLQLRQKYIGRPSVSQRDPILQRRGDLGRLSTLWYERMRLTSEPRANAFLHYMTSMKDALHQLAPIVRHEGTVVFVVGHSRWNGHELPTSDLLFEISQGYFDLVETLWYPIKNRYMSYQRRNGADIDSEYVLVFVRSDK